MAKILKAVTLSQERIYLNQEAESSFSPEEAKPSEMTPASFTQGFEQGLNQGLEQGFAQGYAKAKEEYSDQLDTLQALLTSIPQALKQARNELSQELGSMLLILSQKFFIQQCQDDAFIERQIQGLIEQVNDAQEIELCLNATDFSRLRQGKFSLKISSEKNFCIKPDETLRLGGCLLKTKQGIFDASIEGQIERLKAILLEINEEKHLEP